uniref:Pyruvate kinase n=1 Tax=Chenopodium quinoa TaxID=63459 RepID=A0A803N7P2_CHEQI
MHSGPLLLEEPIRMASILEPSKPVMLDTVGPELQVVNKTERPISLEADSFVVLTPDQTKEANSNLLPINFHGLSKAVMSGDTIFIGQYLFTGSETTSVWLEVSESKGEDVVCLIKNSATLSGPLYTLHVSQIHIDRPTLTEKDKEVVILASPFVLVIKTWGARNNIDFLTLSYTRHAEDIREAREFLSNHCDLQQTQIFAKIENIEGLTHFDEILQEADGIILSRGNLGIDLPPEKVFLFQKAALHKCNMAGKPAVVTRVVDSMTDNLRPTRAEATDVANAVLDGSDAIILGAETLRGLYPVETISTVGRICFEAEKVFNHDTYFKKAGKYAGMPMSHIESIASSAVRAAIKVKASAIICFTSSGRAARSDLKHVPWARQSLIIRGLFPMLADPRHPAESTNATNETILKIALDHGKASGVIKSHDRVVVCQKVADSSVVKIIELAD